MDFSVIGAPNGANTVDSALQFLFCVKCSNALLKYAVPSMRCRI